MQNKAGEKKERLHEKSRELRITSNLEESSVLNMRTDYLLNVINRSTTLKKMATIQTPRLYRTNSAQTKFCIQETNFFLKEENY
jgi:hypothetical protein